PGTHPPARGRPPAVPARGRTAGRRVGRAAAVPQPGPGHGAAGTRPDPLHGGRGAGGGADRLDDPRTSPPATGGAEVGRRSGDGGNSVPNRTLAPERAAGTFMKD